MRLFTFLFPPAKTIRKAPKNSTAQPHFNLTTPAKVSCQDLKGKKLKYCKDCIFTANKVNANKKISRIPKNLTIFALLLTMPKTAHAAKIQHAIAR